MGRRRSGRDPADHHTLDLLADWQPRDPVERFAPATTQAANLRDRIALAVSATLKECGRPREEIAQAMSTYLGERVSKDMLDKYASQGSEGHTIPAHRQIALCKVTGDARLMQLGAEEVGRDCVDQHFKPWIEVGQLADVKAEVDRAYELARRMARRAGR
ncbi:DNA transposition protein [Roseospira goensis]|uniref:DNA transposition protein n=1 Tax=Roseospira goensis TaxID=391922 RepID=A0A7W6WJ09_9PROT|nr:DNA transposition protein [Roseospira goensis]MBB4284505.1 hypothetical protein [Roseospira goensis]